MNARDSARHEPNDGRRKGYHSIGDGEATLGECEALALSLRKQGTEATAELDEDGTARVWVKDPE